MDVDDPMEDNNDSNASSNANTEQQMRQQELFLLQQQDKPKQLIQQTHLQQQQQMLKRSEMNELIMDYLVHEGFKEAAERFREEAGIQPKMETETMGKRIEIRQQIENGEILNAQTLINSYYPELLDNHREIYFRLQQQHLIELIRRQKIEEVLTYVHDHLRVDELKDLGEMERTLALLAYENPDKSPYARLLEISNRLKLASEINDIILQETSGQIEPTKPRLVTLMKLLFWTQNELEKKKIQYPKMSDLFKYDSIFNGLSPTDSNFKNKGSSNSNNGKST